MAFYVVLLGPPGAGKGTQAGKISETLDIPHISTGDLFRDNIRNKTKMGIEVQKYLESGALVPDSITIAMVKDRLSRPDCKNGALMDGFPRTSAQAEAFDEMLKDSFSGKVDFVPCIEVEKSLLVDRISGRRVCKNGHSFHVKYNPSKKEGICDICGEPLIQRTDDNEETVAKRIEAYEKQTAPLIEYYEKKGVLCRIDGTKDIKTVESDITKSLQKLLGK